MKDYQCSIDFIKSPFLVQEWKISDKAGTRRETLRLDMIQGSFTKYHDADIIIFNTGHWWTHQKTYKGYSILITLSQYMCPFQFHKSTFLYKKLNIFFLLSNFLSFSATITSKKAVKCTLD